jgi:hypothetical protein
MAELKIIIVLLIKVLTHKDVEYKKLTYSKTEADNVQLFEYH